jgi:hypothetical protein
VSESSFEARYAVLTNQFIKKLPRGRTFSGEQLRTHCELNDLALPRGRHPNTWGARARYVLMRWAEDGIIQLDGWQPATAKQAHSRLYPRYRKVRSA